MGVGLEISTSGVLGNEAPENRSGRLRTKSPTFNNGKCLDEVASSRRYSQFC